MEREMPAERPEPNEQFWWFPHGRQLVVLTILSVGDTIKMKWETYLGLCAPADPISGHVEWDLAEWAAGREGMQRYIPPVRENELAPNEQLCRTCHGLRFEVERDFEVLGCIWCKGAGKTEKRDEVPLPVRRSQMHPEMPAKSNA